MKIKIDVNKFHKNDCQIRLKSAHLYQSNFILNMNLNLISLLGDYLSKFIYLTDSLNYHYQKQQTMILF